MFTSTLPRLRSRGLGLAVAACLSLWAAPGSAALDIDKRDDILAARASFQAQAGVLEAFTWASAFAPGTHTTGSYTPYLSLAGFTFTAADGSVHSAVGANGVGASFAPGNWIDGPGFDLPNGGATADLALNGEESFDLVFGSPYTSVGMAVASGMGNATSEVDLAGATFTFTALNAGGQVIGSANLVLAAGAPAAAWVTLVASSPISRLQVRETGAASIKDQYFSDVLVTPSAVGVVPEPASALLLALGVMGLGLARLASRRRQGGARRQPARKMSVVTLGLLCLAPQAWAAGTVTYGSLDSFQTATGATAATGPLPFVAVGAYVAVGSGTKAGSVSFIAPGFGFTDWSTLLPGSEITVSNGAGNTAVPNANYNDGLDTVFDVPVFAAGFWFHQPSASAGYTDACNVNPCVASQFQVQLKAGSTVVATLQWTPGQDQAEFWGVASSASFSRMEIREVVGTDDNEFYGAFFTSTLAPVPEPHSMALWLLGLTGVAVVARRGSRPLTRSAQA